MAAIIRMSSQIAKFPRRLPQFGVLALKLVYAGDKIRVFIALLHAFEIAAEFSMGSQNVRMEVHALLHFR